MGAPSLVSRGGAEKKLTSYHTVLSYFTLYHQRRAISPRNIRHEGEAAQRYDILKFCELLLYVFNDNTRSSGQIIWHTCLKWEFALPMNYVYICNLCISYLPKGFTYENLSVRVSCLVEYFFIDYYRINNIENNINLFVELIFNCQLLCCVLIVV